MQNLEEGLSKLKKNYGVEVGGKGFKYPAYTRLPSGILPLDLALAGGIPMGAVSIIYGPEGSGKTSLAKRFVHEFQMRYPDRKVAWIDAENEWDEDWTKLHGVNTEDIYLFKPTSSEEASDIADEIAWSGDAGLIVVDSIAALSSTDQIEKLSTQVVMGGASKSTTTMMRKIGTGMAEHAKAGTPLTVIYINQVREKIGFVMGNPEILPGPKFQNYQAFLKLRLTAKPILKEKIAAVPIYTENSAKVTKKKFPIIRQAAEWETIIYPYNGLKPLTVNNRRQAEAILSELSYLEGNAKSGFTLFGKSYKTKTEAVDIAMQDYDALLAFLVEDLLLLYQDLGDTETVNGDAE